MHEIMKKLSCGIRIVLLKNNFACKLHASVLAAEITGNFARLISMFLPNHLFSLSQHPIPLFKDGFSKSYLQFVLRLSCSP